MDDIDREEAAAILDTMARNTGNGVNHCWWLSRVVPVKEVQGYFLNAERTKAGIKINTTGGPVFWGLRKPVADAVMDVLHMRTAV